MNQRKQLIINMSANFVAYGVSLLISFFLSPYIVRTIGVEANGFVSLANNFASYATLITIALNSLAGRFITISITRADETATNKYFTSVFYANLVIAAFLVLVGSAVVVFLPQLINIPPALLSDVRYLFIFVFANCILSVVGSVFSVATFAKNMLYLESLRNIEANIARALCIVSLFALFQPKVCYLGIASLLSGVYILFRNIGYKKKLLPEVRIHRSSFDIYAVWELVASGIWNTINRLGQILIDGLDLLITNLFVDATAMGVLGLAKTLPSLISSLMGSIASVFSPNYTILYAQERYDDLLVEVRRSMKIMGVITNLPIIVLIVCGQAFFRCWQPTQDPLQLQILSLLTVGCLIFSGGINCLYGIFTVVNKIKVNSLVVLASGAVSTVLVLILVNVTDWGVYAVAGVSTLISIFRNLVFTAPYGAKCLNQKWHAFYPDIFRPALFVTISSFLGYLVVSALSLDGWFGFFFQAAIVLILAMLVGFFVVLSRQDRKYLLAKLIRR